MLDAALNMARRGFPVFPLIERGKKPAIDAFQLHATTDETIIRNWWSYRPDCNIGVCTTGFVVIDIDTKDGRNGVDSYRSIGGNYDTLTVRTPTGGYHCYFKGPDSKLAVDIVPGVDVRSHHGYVVAAGSVTSAVHKDCVDGEYTIVKDTQLAQIPLPIEILLEPPIRRVRADNVELDKETSIANAAVWLQQAEPAIEGKHGNDTTYRICARLVRDYALSEETAFQLLLEHWNNRCIPPWSQGELLQLVRNASEYGIGDRGRALPETQLGQVTVIPTPPVPGPATAQEVGVYMGNAPDPANITPRPWKVTNLLMNGDVTVLGGAGAAGKSVLQIAMAAHFALGKDYGRFKLKVPGIPLRTIIYNAEDDMQEQGRRLLAVCSAFSFDYMEVRKNIAFMDDRHTEICVARIQHGAPVAVEDSIRFIIATSLSTQADVIMYDPMINVHQLNENDNSHMRFVIWIIRQIARATNTAALMAHHTGKGSNMKEKGDADIFRGAGALINSARVGILMSPITIEDATSFGIKADDRSDYARLDNAKTNLFKKTSGALQWLQWLSVGIQTGDQIGVPVMTDMSKALDDRNKLMAEVLHTLLVQNNRGSIQRTAAAKQLAATPGVFFGGKESTLRLMLETVLSKGPLRFMNDTIALNEDRDICLR